MTIVDVGEVVTTLGATVVHANRVQVVRVLLHLRNTECSGDLFLFLLDLLLHVLNLRAQLLLILHHESDCVSCFWLVSGSHLGLERMLAIAMSVLRNGLQLLANILHREEFGNKIEHLTNVVVRAAKVLELVDRSFQMLYLLTEHCHIARNLFTLARVLVHKPINMNLLLHGDAMLMLHHMTILVVKSVKLQAEHIGNLLDPVYLRHISLLIVLNSSVYLITGECLRL